MAKTTLVETNVLTREQEADFNQHVAEIKKIDTLRSGLAGQLAYHLAYIDSKGYHTAQLDANGNHYKSIGKYAEDRWGIKKSTVSEAISTFKRFGNMETGEINSEYKLFSFTALTKIREYSDEDIRAARLIPEQMSVAKIVDKLHKWQGEKEERQEVVDKWNELAKTISDDDKRAMYKEIKKEFGTGEPVIADLPIAKCRVLGTILDRYSKEEPKADANEEPKADAKEEPKVDAKEDVKADSKEKAFVLDAADFAKVADLLARMTGTDMEGVTAIRVKSK